MALRAMLATWILGLKCRASTEEDSAVPCSLWEGRMRILETTTPAILGMHKRQSLKYRVTKANKNCIHVRCFETQHKDLDCLLNIKHKLSTEYFSRELIYSTATRHREPRRGRRPRKNRDLHNFRIAVFCYTQRGSSAEETNRVQTAVWLFSPRFLLGLILL